MKTIALRIKNEDIINWISELEGDGFSANAVVNAMLTYALQKAKDEELTIGFALVPRPVSDDA